MCFLTFLYMANEIFTFEEQDIDLKDSSKIKIKCFLNDDIILKINVYNYGEGVDLKQFNKEVRFYKPDGKVYSETRNIQINNNQMIVTCDRQLTTASDTVVGFIRLWDNYNKQKASYPIEVVVQDNNGTREISQSVLSETEYFDNKINTALQIETHFDNNINVAKNEEVKLTDKISESVTSKNNLDKSNITANNTKSILDQSNANALKTKNDLDVLNNTSITTKGNLDKTNNTALTTNNTLNTTNTNAINTNNTLNTTIKSANDNRNALDTSKTNAINTKKDLDGSIENAKNKKSDLDSSINLSLTKKNELDGSINNANKAKQILDSGNSQAITNKKNLDESNVQASKNLDALNALGNATDLAKDVEIVKKQVLENTYTKIETDSSLTKLESCKDSFVHNMQIKGRTLQNLSPNTSSDVIITREMLKVGVYSIKLHVINNSGEKRLLFVKDGFKYNTFSEPIVLEIGDNKDVIFNNIKINSIEGLGNIYINVLKPDYTPASGVVFSQKMCLEGDWSNKEIPSYFEGIKSVGEADGNKISILSTGKNLINNNFNDWELTGENVDIDNNILKIVGELTKSKRALYKLKCRKITTYSLSIDVKGDNIVNGTTNQYKGVAISFYKGDKYLYEYGLGIDCGTYDWKNVKTTFTPKSNIEFDNIVFSAYLRDCSGTVFYKDIQLEEGTTVTSYEEYKEDKTEILLPSPHMGLPNGVSDVVDYDKNERTKNVKTFVLDPTWGWNRTAVDIDTPNTIEFQCGYPNIKGNSLLICDKFNYIEVNHLWSHDIEGITVNPTKNIQIRISKSKLETPDANGFKKWLQANPTTIYYQLANPITEKLTIKDTLQAFENGYIQLDNAITPCTSLEYSTNIMSIVSRMVENQDKVIDRLAVLESTILTLVSNNIVNK